MKYTPLHVHSEYSLLDGMSKCEDIAKRTIEIGADACALTDHGSLGGAMDFVEVMQDKGLKPILGCELYVCKDDVTVQEPENRLTSTKLETSSRLSPGGHEG